MNKQNQIEYFHSIVGPRIDVVFMTSSIVYYALNYLQIVLKNDEVYIAEAIDTNDPYPIDDALFVKTSGGKVYRHVISYKDAWMMNLANFVKDIILLRKISTLFPDDTDSA